MNFDIELVGKIGSMALVNREYNDINYNVISRISRELLPGYVWVTSGAVEIGRLDYLQRNGRELSGGEGDNKTDYAAQGQSILMQTYRQYIDSRFSVRQILVEHYHFNDAEKSSHLRETILRCPSQNAIPIINYNDAVSSEENVKMELSALKSKLANVHECLDNDETAAQLACLLKARRLLILTSVDGIYENIDDPATLVAEISGSDTAELLANIDRYASGCRGASRRGANGARAKLEYIKAPAQNGTEVIIANAKYRIKDILSGAAPRTVVKVR
ncbi:MAG TPA: uridylate kinase [Eubacteriales bacterium]|jgi:glutamate 5-kinase|nr:uridylate kinase [Clostridia bacterium]HRR89621.1 uridylate kinase [Eubacteriales bacterium]HRU83771.1 uridylate kinase [Eubacteriales bacterium]